MASDPDVLIGNGISTSTVKGSTLGGGGGISGIEIQDDGVTIVPTATVINFVGATVTGGGGGVAVVTIDPSFTTLQDAYDNGSAGQQVIQLSADNLGITIQDTVAHLPGTTTLFGVGKNNPTTDADYFFNVQKYNATEGMVVGTNRLWQLNASRYVGLLVGPSPNSRIELRSQNDGDPGSHGTIDLNADEEINLVSNGGALSGHTLINIGSDGGNEYVSIYGETFAITPAVITFDASTDMTLGFAAVTTEGANAPTFTILGADGGPSDDGTGPVPAGQGTNITIQAGSGGVDNGGGAGAGGNLVFKAGSAQYAGGTDGHIDFSTNTGTAGGAYVWFDAFQLGVNFACDIVSNNGRIAFGNLGGTTGATGTVKPYDKTVGSTVASPLNIIAGDQTATGVGGLLTLAGGASAANTGGAAVLRGGAAGGTSKTGGAVTVAGGAGSATTGPGGSVTIIGGGGTGAANGNVSIGTASTVNVNVGQTGVTTTTISGNATLGASSSDALTITATVAGDLAFATGTHAIDTGASGTLNIATTNASTLGLGRTAGTINLNSATFTAVANTSTFQNVAGTKIWWDLSSAGNTLDICTTGNMTTHISGEEVGIGVNSNCHTARLGRVVSSGLETRCQGTTIIVDSYSTVDIGTVDGTVVNIGRSGQSLGFFGVSAVTRQATPTDTASIIALLQAYGLSQ